jgi:hypothetical protein
MGGRVLHDLSADGIVGERLSSCGVPLFHACAVLQICCSISLLRVLEPLPSLQRQQAEVKHLQEALWHFGIPPCILEILFVSAGVDSRLAFCQPSL